MWGARHDLCGDEVHVFFGCVCSLAVKGIVGFVKTVKRVAFLSRYDRMLNCLDGSIPRLERETSFGRK